MESGLVDSEWQQIKAVKSLLDSQGWKIYKERLKDLHSHIDNQVAQQTSNFLNESGVNRLNYLLGQRNIIEQILLVEESLLDEISPTQEPEHNSSEFSN